MAKNVLGSYLYELKPYINTSEWKKASGEIDKALKSSKISYDEFEGKRKAYADTLAQAQKVEAQLNIVKEQIKHTTDATTLASLNKLQGSRAEEEHERTGLEGSLQSLLEKLNLQKADLITSAQMTEMPSNLSKISGGLSKFASGITAAYGATTSFVESIKKAINTSIEIANKAAEMSNKLNAFGAFGSMGTRDMMSRYGVSSTRANAMSTALAQMGLSESDIGRMTDKQRDAYDSLIQHFEDGIDRIDSTKLKEYYETMEDFQLAQAKWKMDLQNTILKIFAESDSFKKLTGSLANFFEKSIEFLESPIVQWFFDVFIEFLSSLVDFASWVLGIFGGGNSSTTTNNNNNSRNTYYIYGSDYSSNNDLARSIALETTGGGIG
jgi:hypothetical protein